QMLVRQRQNVPGQAPELFLFVAPAIVTAALGESEAEERTLSAAVEDDCAVATRSPLTRPVDSQLDDAAAKIGVDLPTLNAAHRIEQCRIGDPFLACETPEPGIPEYPQDEAPLPFAICHL